MEKGTLRFNKLYKSIDGISLKVLTSCLKTLEANNFVTRTAYSKYLLELNTA